MLKFDIRNFNKDTVRALRPLVREAEFVSFDCEFSAVSCKLDGIHPISPDEVYKIKREAVQGASLLELGISLIMPEKDGKREAIILSFYTCAEKRLRHGRRAFEPSCAYFLANNCFDFNRCFRLGVEHRPLSEFPAPLELLLKGGEAAEGVEDWPLPETKPAELFFRGKNFVSSELFKLDEFFLDRYSEFVKDHSSSKLVLPVSEKPEVDFLASVKSRFNVKMKEDDLVNASFQQKQVTLTKRPPKEKKEAIVKDYDKEPAPSDMFETFGLSLLVYYIGLYKKPIILHNGFYDFLYVVQNFVKPLPPSLPEFNALNERIGWKILDTKLIVRLNEKIFGGLHMTRLDQLFDAFNKVSPLMDKTKLTVAKYLGEFCQSLVEEMPNFKSDFLVDVEHAKFSLHNAGFDSYLTALVFLHLQQTIKDLSPVQNHVFMGSVRGIKLRLFNGDSIDDLLHVPELEGTCLDVDTSLVDPGLSEQVTSMMQGFGSFGVESIGGGRFFVVYKNFAGKNVTVDNLAEELRKVPGMAVRKYRDRLPLI